MRIIRRNDAAGSRVVAPGTFDGVHRGHRRLIIAARSLANEMGVPLRVCTFDRHPLEILRPENPPELLSTTPEKAAEMCRLGVDDEVDDAAEVDHQFQVVPQTAARRVDAVLVGELRIEPRRGVHLPAVLEGAAVQVAVD